MQSYTVRSYMVLRRTNQDKADAGWFGAVTVLEQRGQAALCHNRQVAIDAAFSRAENCLHRSPPRWIINARYYYACMQFCVDRGSALLRDSKRFRTSSGGQHNKSICLPREAFDAGTWLGTGMAVHTAISVPTTII